MWSGGRGTAWKWQIRWNFTILIFSLYRGHELLTWNLLEAQGNGGKKGIFFSFQELEEILARGPNLVISYARLLFIFTQELKEKPSLLVFLRSAKEMVSLLERVK